MKDLKGRAIRSAAARSAGQTASILIKLGSMMALARLLDPSDFGLVAMATVVTGLLSIFSTGGLSQATIQRAEISDAQISTLFWVNIGIGFVLAGLCFAVAPLFAILFVEPKAQIVIAALSIVFVIGAAGVQHSALLQRQLRFVTLTCIEVASYASAAIISVVMALIGFGYWALVANLVIAPFMLTLGSWIASGWLPGPPRKNSDVLSMLHFGSVITLNGFVVYVAYNLEKFLIGRYFGADSLGLYSRASQLIAMPVEILNGTLSNVVFSSLSRLQDEPERLKLFFLKVYTLVVSITMPATVFCATFADDIILLLLGPKWGSAAMIFRLLAPTILVFGIINPLAWLLLASGLHVRSLRIALVLAPLVICSYLVGIPWGPNGVAFCYSTMMCLWVVPHVMWCLHGTNIALSTLFLAAGRPLISAIVAGSLAAGFDYLFMSTTWPLLNLAVAGAVMGVVYMALIIYVCKQKELYLDVYRGLRFGV